MQEDRHRGELASKFGGVGAAPSDDLWGKIEAGLSGKKKRKGVVWWWIGSGLAAGLSALFLVTSFYKNGQNDSQVARNNDTLRFNENSIVRHSESNLLLNNEQLEQSNDTALNLNEPIIETPGFEKPNKINTSNYISTNTIKDRNQPKDDIVSTTATVKSFDVDLLPGTAISKLDVSHLIQIPEDHIANAVIIPNADKVRKWEVGLEAGYYPFIGEESPGENAVTNDNVGGLGVDFPSVGSNNSSISKRLLMAELLIGYRIKPRVLLQSGIQFAQFSMVQKTELNNGLGYSEQKVKQRSVALPLLIQFDFTKRDKLNITGGLGFINEFPFQMKSSLKYGGAENEAIAPLSFAKENVFGEAYFGAIELNVGMSYHLTKQLRLQVSPAFRYYTIQSVKDGSEIISATRYWIGGKAGLILAL